MLVTWVEESHGVGFVRTLGVGVEFLIRLQEFVLYVLFHVKFF